MPKPSSDAYAVAAAERALRSWRLEALAERRRSGQSVARDVRLAHAERQVAALRAFLAGSRDSHGLLRGG